MAVPKAKKKTKKELLKENGIPQEKEQTMIMNASWMVLACTGIYPGSEIRYGKKAMDTLINTYWGQMDIIHDENVKRCKMGLPGVTPLEVVKRADEALNLGLEKRLGKAFRDNRYKLGCNYLVAGCMELTLIRLGWKYPRILRWFDGYMALLEEVNNPRQATTAKSIYEWCQQLTGVRVNEKVVWDGR